MEQEISQLREQLQKQEKLASLGILSAGIAHEIQNPLNFVGFSGNPQCRHCPRDSESA